MPNQYKVNKAQQYTSINEPQSFTVMINNLQTFKQG